VKSLASAAVLGLLASGLAGLSGCFLPIVHGDAATLWTVPVLGRAPVLFVMAGYAITAAMGLVAIARPPRPWQGGVALAASGFVAAKLYQLLDGLFAHLAVGGLVLVGAAVVGAACGIATLFAAPATS
jgi:hypothetical protein